MTYDLGWYTEKYVLYLRLPENPSMEEFDDINQEITSILANSSITLSIIIDTNKLKTGYHTATYLRNTQKYMNHPKLDNIYVVANNKLNRLIMTLGFSLCRAHFIQFENFKALENTLIKTGYYPTGTGLNFVNK
ncbi:MAG: hypothetical protein Phog2KO_44950 [Phototrophicaceae bacterium]